MEFEKWFSAATIKWVILWLAITREPYIILFSWGLGVFFRIIVIPVEWLELYRQNCECKQKRRVIDGITLRISHSLRLSDGRDCTTIAISTLATIPTPRCYWRMVIFKVLAGLPATVTDNVIHNTIPTTWK